MPQDAEDAKPKRTYIQVIWLCKYGLTCIGDDKGKHDDVTDAEQCRQFNLELARSSNDPKRKRV